ncbi:BolA family transcriptional regulator [Rhodovarius crocodyli]|uniref:BolA family transcriptional regulator n=1 Tax=Rhodovarius crocodyli TaxID=1979269 RepID=A0A437MIV5_9PROT|nr:BolA family protein [Rhodovarius crocodyli]RVT97580.1 BolA family transcriptional regulator [Rhodovarius crocodyli]
MTRAQRIHAQMTSRFAPEALEVIDDSALHAGHAGARPGGETHYTLVMVSAAFAGLNRVARQRLVNEALAEEFSTGLHAMALKLKAPGE